MRLPDFDGVLDEGIDEVPRTVRLVTHPEISASNFKRPPRTDLDALRAQLEGLPRKWYPVPAWDHSAVREPGMSAQDYMKTVPTTSKMFGLRGMDVIRRNGRIYVRLQEQK